MRNDNKFTSAAAAVREVLATTEKDVIFSGYDLKNNCVKLLPSCSNMYVDTFLREMRKFCADQYELISRSESLYRKITPSRRAKEKELLIKRLQNAQQLELFEGAL